MRTLIIVVAALAATLAAGGTAAALSSIGVSPTTFAASAFLVHGGPQGSLGCNVTLAGTLASRTAKVSGATVGAITSATSGSCSDNIAFSNVVSITTLTPVAITYVSFTGTLPNILSLNLTFKLFNLFYLWNSGVTCLYGYTDVSVRADSGSANSVTRFTKTSAANIPLISGGFGCPSSRDPGLGTETLATRLTLTLQ